MTHDPAEPAQSTNQTAAPPAIMEVKAHPLSQYDEALQTSFAQSVAAQAGRLDELAKLIITLNIAIPGLYATAMKLSSDRAELLQQLWPIAFALCCWLAALTLALASLFPQKWRVDPDNLSEIERYFSQSARRKRKQLGFACAFSFMVSAQR